jgi:hydrogenase maturation protease
MKTLVIGYGNTLRGDDGVGPAVAERLGAMAFEEVEVRAATQLQLEWAVEWSGYERVVLIDAAVDGAVVSRERVWPGDGGEGDGGAHELDAGELLTLARLLYGREPEVWRWRIRGESFGIGDQLTPGVRAAADVVTERIARSLADGDGFPNAGGGRIAGFTSV